MRRPMLALALLGTLWTFPMASAAQAVGTITGTVTSAETHQPLAAVFIEVPSLNRTALTNEQGRFIIVSVPYGTYTVRASVIGYHQVTAEVTVGATPMSMSLAMGADPLLLEELVVTGYGTERRANVAGAVSSLRTEKITAIPVTSVNQALQGRMAGIQINQNSGTPGGAMTVRVRGASSISGGNDPLYVVDGVR